MKKNVNQYIAYVAGIKKRLTAPIVLNGVTYTPAALAKLFQSVVDESDALDAARASENAALVQFRTTEEAAHPVAISFGAYLRAAYGNDPSYLSDFDIASKKPKKVTVAVKAQAATKAKATREARHTMGKRQKAQIVPVLPTTQPVVKA